MTLISETAPRPDYAGGFYRLLGDRGLGTALSAVHSALIRGGNAVPFAVLRAMDYDRVLNEHDLFAAVVARRDDAPVFAAAVCVVGTPRKQVQVDMLAWRADPPGLFLFQLTEATAWDTRKAQAERNDLDAAAGTLRERFAPLLPPDAVHGRVVSFHAETDAGLGFKGRHDDAWTGRAFCGFLGVDYDAVRDHLKRHQAENRRHLAKTLAACPAFRAELEALGWTGPDDKA